MCIASTPFIFKEITIKNSEVDTLVETWQKRNVYEIIEQTIYPLSTVLFLQDVLPVVPHGHPTAEQPHSSFFTNRLRTTIQHGERVTTTAVV